MYEKRLLELYRQPLLPMDHVHYLRKMRDEMGINPKVCYDIGACVLHWTNRAKEIWPNSEFVLFEAMDTVEFLYKTLPFKYEIGVFSDVDDKELVFYQNSEHPGGNSYYRENEIFSPNAPRLWTDEHGLKRLSKTIDKVVRDNNFPLPNLVKIDVQGCEVDILKGMKNTIAHAKDLIVELQNVQYNKGAPLVTESIPFIESLGFTLVAPRFSNSNPAAPDADYHFTRR